MAPNRPWTEKEVSLLRELWATKIPAREIAARLGRPLRATYNKAFKLKLPKKYDPNAKRLTREQKLWLKLNFPVMRTEICAAHLGMHVRTCIRKARELSIEKSPEFMKECIDFMTARAKESNLKNGTYPPKGVVNANIAKGAKYRFKKKKNAAQN